MHSLFLIPESVVHESGAGKIFDLGEHPPSLLVTLGITEVVEQESLEVGIYGSQDGTEWSASPLASFPQKFYEGVSSLLLDPVEHITFRYIRAQWKTNRWGRGSKTPMFRIYLFLEPVDQAGNVTGAEAVVDVHNRHIA